MALVESQQARLPNTKMLLPDMIRLMILWDAIIVVVNECLERHWGMCPQIRMDFPAPTTIKLKM